MKRVAIVTGGSRGIGRAIRDLLIEKGWDVTAPNRAKLDWTSPESVQAYYRGLSGRVDAIVFCHGEWFLNEWQSGDDYLRHFNMRVNFPALFIRETTADMVDAGVVFVSSTQAFDGSVSTMPYAAACAAQLRLMKGCAKDRVNGAKYNALCPGLTDTDMGKIVLATGGAKPGAPMNTPEFVAGEIVKLIESGDNGKIMRVVDNKASEATWNW